MRCGCFPLGLLAKRPLKNDVLTRAANTYAVPDRKTFDIVITVEFRFFWVALSAMIGYLASRLFAIVVILNFPFEKIGIRGVATKSKFDFPIDLNDS